MLRARLATAAVAIPLLLVLIFLAPPWGWALVVTVVASLALVEYVGLAFGERAGPRMVCLLLGAAVLAAALTQPEPGPRVTAAISFIMVGGLTYVVCCRRDLDRGLTDLGLMAVGILYSALLLPHFYWLHRLASGPQWVTFVITIAMAGDSSGYFVGHAIGRHKLIPHLSPGKTVEGALGIIAASLIAGAACKLVLLPQRSWTEILILSFIMAVIGQVGDLGESVMKRSFGVKESGWILPGHGGVLDRIDSLLFPVTLLYYYLLLSAGPALEA